MAAPIPRNPNPPHNRRNRRPAQQERLELFINEHRLPPGRLPLYINRIFRWAFFLVVEALILVFCFGICGAAFDGAPDEFKPLFWLIQIAMFIVFTYHAIFRTDIFR